MSEIIINCNQNNKIIAIVNNGNLIEQYEENQSSHRIEGNIYLGKVVDVLPGMQAAFIDIGDETKAFLHIKDVLPKVSNETGNKNEEYSKYNIKDYIRVGNPIIVQVKKDKTDRKGARVSTHLNIGGRFIALMPDLNFITVSQKIENLDEAKRLKNIVQNIETNNHGIVLRTSAEGKEKELIQQDVKNVINLYNEIKQKTEKLISSNEVIPQIIYENGGIVNKILIDLIDKDIEKIWVNNQIEYENIKKFLQKMNINDNIIEFKFNTNLLDLYSINNQIEKIKNRKVWLKCGGFIAIDKTEALTAIDVNTGKFTGKISLEETVLKVNQEATIEIAKQLRLRDIGGIVIIDYIDMEQKQNEEKIVELLKNELKYDRAKTQVIGFSKLHLLEMTRKHVFSNSSQIGDETKFEN